MTKIFKNLLFLISLFFIFYSCNEEKVLNPSLDKQSYLEGKEVSKNKDAVSEAVDFVNEYFHEFSYNPRSTNAVAYANQSVNISKQSIDTIYEIKEDGNHGKTLLKLICFTPSGYALISALESSKTPPVLFYSKGKFNQENINPGLVIYINNFVENLKVKEDINVDDNSGASYYIPSEENVQRCGCIKRKVTGASYTKEIEKEGPLLSTMWHQGSPFNDKCPIINGKRAAAGCVAIAVSQILLHNRKIGILDWDKLNAKVNLYNPDDKDKENNALKAYFVAYIGQKVNTKYGLSEDGGSSAYNDQVLSGCFQYGLGAYRNARLINYNYEECVKLINDNKPVYISASEAGSKTGHAWVVDGYKEIEKSTKYRIYYEKPKPKPGVPQLGHSHGGEDPFGTDSRYYSYLHMNWGWGSSYQGEEAWCYESKWEVAGSNYQYGKQMISY